MARKNEHVYVIFHKSKRHNYKWYLITGAYDTRSEALQVINDSILWLSEYQRPGDKPVEFKIIKVSIPIPK